MTEAQVPHKALQRKKVIIQRDIEKDVFYREASFYDNTKAVSSEQARRLAKPYLALLTRPALPYRPKTMPGGSRLLSSRAMTSPLTSKS